MPRALSATHSTALHAPHARDNGKVAKTSESRWNDRLTDTHRYLRKTHIHATRSLAAFPVMYSPIPLI
jgi:hypothetical protein